MLCLFGTAQIMNIRLKNSELSEFRYTVEFQSMVPVHWLLVCYIVRHISTGTTVRIICFFFKLNATDLKKKLEYSKTTTVNFTSIGTLGTSTVSVGQ
jgi:hypothetical protein